MSSSYTSVRRSPRRERRRSHPARFLLFLALFLVLAALVVLLVLTLRSSGTRALQFAVMPFSADDTFAPFRSGAVYIDAKAEELWYADASGRKGWGFRHADPTLKLATSSEIVAAWGGDKLQVISSTGKILINKQYESELKAVRCGVASVAVALRDRTRVTEEHDGSVILVYDLAGDLLDKIDDLTLDLMDFGFFGEDDQLFAILGHTDSVSVGSRVAVYNPSAQKSTGYVRVNDELVYDAYFTANEIVAVGTENIYAFSYTGDLRSKTPCAGLIALSDTTYATRSNLVVTLARPDAEGRFSSYTVYTLTAPPYAVDPSVEGKAALCTAGGSVYIFGADLVERLDTRSGARTTYAMPHSADAVITAGGSDNCVFAVSGDSVFCLRLP